MVFFGVGCLENTEQRNAARQAAREVWIPPELPFIDPETLVIQVSREHIVYMSHISEERVLADSEEENEIVVMPSVLDETFFRAL